jgi:hypothetical protein
LPGHDQATSPASSAPWSAGTGLSAVLTARLGAMDGAVLDDSRPLGYGWGCIAASEMV